MTQAHAALFNNIIDLTEDENDSDQLETLSTAASKAQAAAARLTNQLESLASASNRYHFVNTVGGTGKIVPSGKNVRPATNGYSKVSEAEIVLPSDLPSADTGLLSASTGPRSGVSGQRESLPLAERPHSWIRPQLATNNRPLTPVPSTDCQKMSPSNTRSPRAAAQSAGRVIAQTYDMLNPLEAQQEAKLNTPRKPGRPKLDQWTPKSHPHHNSAKSENHDRDHRSSPTRRIAQLDGHDDRDDDISTESASKEAGMTSRDTRRGRNASPESGLVSIQAEKQIRSLGSVNLLDYTETKSSRNELPLLAKESEMTEGDERIHASKENQPFSTPVSAVNTLATTLAPSEAHSTKVSSRHESADKSVIEGATTAHQATALSEARAQPARAPTNMPALSKIFADVVFPAIKKAKKLHKEQLPEDELISIGKIVATEVVDQKLKKLPPQDLLEPTESQKKEMKKFAKKIYHEKVVVSCKMHADDSNSAGNQYQQSDIERKNNMKYTISGNQTNSAQASSSVQETQSTAHPAKITKLSEYLKKLEDEALPSDIEVFQNSSSVHTQAPSRKDQVEMSSPPQSYREASMLSADRVICDSLNDPVDEKSVSLQEISIAPAPQLDLDSSTMSSFAPDFDRGRYPAQRRRRGNKFYTPEKTAKPPKSSEYRFELSGARRSSVSESITASRTGPPGLESTQKGSEDEVSQMLINRVTTDPEVKALFEAVASGIASPAQSKAFQDITNKLRESRNFGGLSESVNEVVDLEIRPKRGGRPRGSHNKITTHSNHTPPSESEPPIPTLIMARGNDAPSKRSDKRSSRPPLAKPAKSPQVADQVPEPRKLATANDPDLELLAASMAADNSEDRPPANKGHRYRVDPSDQEKLVNQSNLVKYAGPAANQREQQLSNAKKSTIIRIETEEKDPSNRPLHHTASLLRARELGWDSRGRHVETHSELRLRIAEKIEAWRSWKGASGDIVAAAWSPDSTTYAVGAAAHTNPEDVQYNRPCNLLLGDITCNTLNELPDHRVDRPKPETLGDTYNARRAVYDACDPMVYTTVSSIAFSPSADRMYSASHDHTVKVWDVTATEKKCLKTLRHNANVTSVEASAIEQGLFATASDVIDDSIRIYYSENSDHSKPVHVAFSASRAQQRRQFQIYPECIRWGSNSFTSHLLLAGFRQSEYGDGEIPREGQLCLWDANAFNFIKVMPSSQGVLAAAWHPVHNFFATGGAPGGNLLSNKRTTKTVVRTWDLRKPKSYSEEFECSAADMQDITFHPTNINIVTAGCTDGTSFVWDWRKPDIPVHRLKHGNPLSDWDHTRGRREEVDTGVMMSLWGLYGSLFYTGSSDGMVKAWDIRRNPADVLVRNVARFGAGIQSGAFSPDGTNLVVGDADGGVHILSSAPCGPQPIHRASDDVSPEVAINFVRDSSGSGLALNPDDDDPGTEGREEAKLLTDSKQLVYHSEFGVTQGYKYQGPFANQQREEAREVGVELSRLKMGGTESMPSFLRTARESIAVEDTRRAFIAARKQSIVQSYPGSKAAQLAATKGPDEQPKPKSQAYGSSRLSSFWDPEPRVPAKRASDADDRGVQKRARSKSPSPEFIGLVKKNTIPESKMVEENHWWPDLGKDEIEKAIARVSLQAHRTHL